MSNNINCTKCNQTSCSCNACQSCTSYDPCGQPGCVDGCLDYIKTDCIQISKDITIGSITYPKGTAQTVINDAYVNAILNGVPSLLPPGFDPMFILSITPFYFFY